jgi:hypothetical protein
MEDTRKIEPTTATTTTIEEFTTDELVFEDLEERYAMEGKIECGCTSTSDCCCCCVYVF